MNIFSFLEFRNNPSFPHNEAGVPHKESDVVRNGRIFWIIITEDLTQVDGIVVLDLMSPMKWPQEHFMTVKYQRNCEMQVAGSLYLLMYLPRIF